MKATDAGLIALRLLGVVFLVYGATCIVQSAVWFAVPDADVIEGPSLASMGLAALLACLVQTLAGIAMIVFARKMSNLLFGTTGDLEIRITARSLLAAALALAGAWLAVGVLPSLGTTVAHFLWVLRAGAEAERRGFLTSDTFLQVLGDALMLGVGVLLFAKSKWLARRWSGLPDE